MKDKIFYKVVHSFGNSLFSVLCSKFIKNFNNSRNIVYIPNRWVKPRNNKKIKCGPLAVFDTLKHAENFANKSLCFKRQDIEIWECNIIKSKKDKSLYVICKSNYSLAYRELESCPYGTIFADKIKLLSCVKKMHY